MNGDSGQSSMWWGTNHVNEKYRLQSQALSDSLSHCFFLRLPAHEFASRPCERHPQF